METGISVICEVSKGMFASEYCVKIKTEDGDYWSGAVDKELILDEPTVVEDKFVEARMYAYLINYDLKKDTGLIELPVEDSSRGRRICVDLNMLRKENIPA